jgi:hypothetical protein
MSYSGRFRVPEIGERIGEWEVIGAPERVYELQWGVRCRCSCGTMRVLTLQTIDRGHSLRCSGCKKVGLPKRGQRFGLLTVLEDATHSREVSVRCECGNERIVTAGNLSKGLSRSCGCALPNVKTHRGTGTQLHRCWLGIIQRCQDPNSCSYPRYGGRGITVCREWSERFEPFRDWALSNGFQEGLTIDRIDNGGGYEPGNCRWVTMKEQARNTRRNRMVAAFGETKCVADWADDPRCHVSQSTLLARVVRGHMKPEQCIITPLQNGRWGDLKP